MNSVRSAKAVAKDMGVSDTTIWRWIKQGLLTKVNIAGKAYITLESLNLFNQRAIRGDFAQDCHGVCAPERKLLTISGGMA